LGALGECFGRVVGCRDVASDRGRCGGAMVASYDATWRLEGPEPRIELLPSSSQQVRRIKREMSEFFLVL